MSLFNIVLHVCDIKIVQLFFLSRGVLLHPKALRDTATVCAVAVFCC